MDSFSASVKDSWELGIREENLAFSCVLLEDNTKNRR